jgi:hypothetical protein
MPKAAAERLMKDKGMPTVEAQIKKLGYSWIAGLRRFFQPYTVRGDVNQSQTWRAA